METELECGGCDTKHAAAGAHCPSRGGGAKALECAEMLVKSSIRPAETIRCAACRTGLVGYFGSFLYSREWRLTRCRLSLSAYFAAAAKRRHDLGVRLAKGLLMW